MIDLSALERLVSSGKKFNLHTHTTFCDGRDTAEEMVLAAIEKGFGVLGFSGHSYTAFDEEYCMSRSSTVKYREEIRALKEKYAGRIEILCGVEQDYFSEEPTDGYDYVIGSAHYLKMGEDYITVDKSPESLRDSVIKYWNGDFYAMIEEYFTLEGDVAEKTGADIIGHFDLVRKFNRGGALFDEENPRYLAAAQKAADRLLAAPKSPWFEINTGAIAKGRTDLPYPSAALTAYIRDRGGRFLLSSDCHDKNKLDFGFDRFVDWPD